MRWIGITLFFLSAVCFANHCPDKRLQHAVIGGNTIDGSVRLHHKPLRFAQVRLFFPDGRSAWVGTTEKDGRFHIANLQPETYRLDVLGWGSTTISISQELDKLPNGQTFSFSEQLMDDECIATTSMTD